MELVLFVTLLEFVLNIYFSLIFPEVSLYQSQDVSLKMMPVLESRMTFIKRFVLALSLGILLTIIISLAWYLILN